MALSDIDKTYRVQLCSTCEHPGGQHIIDAGCRLCDCAGWQGGRQGHWTDRMTLELVEARWAAHSGSPGGSDV